MRSFVLARLSDLPSHLSTLQSERPPTVWSDTLFDRHVDVDTFDSSILQDDAHKTANGPFEAEDQPIMKLESAG